MLTNTHFGSRFYTFRAILVVETTFPIAKHFNISYIYIRNKQKKSIAKLTIS